MPPEVMPRVLLIGAGLAALTLFAAPARAGSVPDCSQTLKTAAAPCTAIVPPCPWKAQPCEE